jgi:hypothetical protein
VLLSPAAICSTTERIVWGGKRCPDIATGRWERRINCDTKDQIDIGRIGAVESVKYVVVVRKPWLHCSTTNLL